MVPRKTAYELSTSQVTTPTPVIALFWNLAKEHREHLGTVLDMGAGDCRLASGAPIDRYVAVELDRRRTAVSKLPPNGKLIHGCVFRHPGSNYDACIANPPYVRHHYIESPWKEKTAARLKRELDISLDKHCNLYLYFLCLGLLKTHKSGLLGLIVPYEWVSRPSAKNIREYIQRKRWNVAVYRFQMSIFDGVMTTASITFVDKSTNAGRWSYFDIAPGFRIVPRAGVVDSRSGVLQYENPGSIRALRGLSPGTQKVFTLTENERIDAGLTKWDVFPCVTSLRKVPRKLRVLTRSAFEKHFVRAGEKCWLIRSHQESRRATLEAYLRSIPKQHRQTYTCLNQRPWFKYQPHPVPQILVASGFTRFGPKVLINCTGAHAVGSVYGIHAKKGLPTRRLQRHLRVINFEKQVVAHAKSLKKIEVKQLNAVLKKFGATL